MLTFAGLSQFIWIYSNSSGYPNLSGFISGSAEIQQEDPSLRRHQPNRKGMGLGTVNKSLMNEPRSHFFAFIRRQVGVNV
jgi:hypothetical protein